MAAQKNAFCDKKRNVIRPSDNKKCTFSFLCLHNVFIRTFSARYIFNKRGL